MTHPARPISLTTTGAAPTTPPDAPALAPTALLRAAVSGGPAPLPDPSSVGRRESWIVLLGVTLLFAVEAAWISYGVRFGMGDALARTYSALAVIKSADPHLAAIGFIWPPLPAFLQIFIAWFPGSTTYAFTGGLVSALSAGGAALVMDHLLARAGLARAWRWPALALYVFNPYIALYSGVGMSEMPFVLCFVLAVYAFLRWSEAGRWTWLVGAGLATGAMVLVRYDAIPFAIVFAGAIMLTMAAKHRQFEPARVEGYLFAYSVPVAYIAIMWIYFNWQIMGDPLHFLRSEYSNTFLVRDVAAQREVLQLQESVGAFLRYLLDITIAFAPALPIALVGVVAMCWRRRDVSLLALAALLLVVPLFQAVSYRQGQTFGFSRFYISLIPAGVIAVAELVRLARGHAWRLAGALALLASIALADVTTAVAMWRMDRLEGACTLTVSVERQFLESLLHPRRRVEACAGERAMADFIVRNVHERSVITDVTGRDVVLFTRQPALFVLPSDEDHYTLAQNRRGLEYVLTNVHQSPEFRALEEYFPLLNSESPPGLTLVHSEGDLRLYRIDR